MRTICVLIIAFLLVIPANAETIVSNQTVGEWFYFLSVNPIYGDNIIYTWSIDNITVVNQEQGRYFWIQNWTSEGPHEVLVIVENATGASMWRKWFVNVSASSACCENPFYIVPWMNMSVERITVDISFDSRFIQVNSIKPVEEMGDILQLLSNPTMISTINNAAGSVNITITPPVIAHLDNQSVYVAKINYTLISTTRPFQTFDFKVNLYEENNPVPKVWDYYALSNVNPSYNAITDNVINMSDILQLGECFGSIDLISQKCRESNFVNGTEFDVRNIVYLVKKNLYGSSLGHRW